MIGRVFLPGRGPKNLCSSHMRSRLCCANHSLFWELLQGGDPLAGSANCLKIVLLVDPTALRCGRVYGTSPVGGRSVPVRCRRNNSEQLEQKPKDRSVLSPPVSRRPKSLPGSCLQVSASQNSRRSSAGVSGRLRVADQSVASPPLSSRVNLLNPRIWRVSWTLAGRPLALRYNGLTMPAELELSQAHGEDGQRRPRLRDTKTAAAAS